ncbi:MAG: tryptophan 7-halogenase [Acidobacteriota bacterium]|nr:tryptophan 7-halogenase [Acidobacteriota bacterium]
MPEHEEQQYYDVVICGGGFAGLTLARQLRLSLPKLSILVIERTKRPLPVAAYKVGESIGTAPTFWLREILGLEEQVDKHVEKKGLHFIGTGGTGPFAERIEFTARARPLTGYPAYQLDRGLFENDLREANDALGIEMREDCLVKDITTQGRGSHTVTCRRLTTGQETAVSCRFVVDATGRRRLLAMKRGLAKEAEHPANATWWRVKRALDVSELVPEENTDWRRRVETRRETTLHLFGKGYWMWFIPLPDDYTSIGIVGGSRHHPIAERSSYEGSFAWLRQHEPEVADWLADTEPIDFLAYKKLAHSTEQAFDIDGWFSIGEAAAFTDPFFSNGSDLIAWANTIVTHLIRLELEERLSREIVDQYNELFLGWVGMIIDKFRGMYDVLGDDYLMLMKPVWDFGQYFAGPAHLLFLGFLEHEEILPEYLALARRFIRLNRQVQNLFVSWAGLRPEKKLPAGLYEPVKAFPRILDVVRGSVCQKSPRQFLAEMTASLRLFEDYARVFFRMAVADVYPDAEERAATAWVNPYAVGLQPETWEKDGLFRPADEPRVGDLAPLNADLDHIRTRVAYAHGR